MSWCIRFVKKRKKNHNKFIITKPVYFVKFWKDIIRIKPAVLEQLNINESIKWQRWTVNVRPSLCVSGRVFFILVFSSCWLVGPSETSACPETRNWKLFNFYIILFMLCHEFPQDPRGIAGSSRLGFFWEGNPIAHPHYHRDVPCKTPSESWNNA
jgi:hypothetical protein